MKKLLAIISILMFLPNMVLAQEITYMGVENEIVSANEVKVAVDITFNPPLTDKFVLPFYASVSDLVSNLGSDCFFEKRTYGSDIICSLTSLSEERKSLKLNFTASTLITKDGSQFIFRNDIFIPSHISSFFYQINLPPGTGLPQDKSLVSPEGWETTTDGRRIFLFWNRNNLINGRIFSTSVLYEPTSIITGLLLGPRAQIALIGGGIGIVLVAFILWKRRSMLQVVLPILKDDEKRIFEAIMKHGSGVHQRLIVRESNYSKAKVSKVLKSLEQRGLVKLERIGRSNKVHMIEKFTEKSLNKPGNNQTL